MGNPVRKQDYLFQRAQSANWCIRLTDEKGRRYIQSLGTPDKLMAERAAGVLVSQHKARLLAKRPHIIATPYKLNPGEYPFDDGTTKGRAIATEREIIYLTKSGAFIRSEPNGPGRQIVNLPLPAVLTGDGTVPDHTKIAPGATVVSLNALHAEFENGPTPPKPKQGEGPDDHVLETYLTQKCITGYRDKEAREMWRIFRAEVAKRLKDCTRDDGRKIVAYLVKEAAEQGRDAKSATLRRRMVPLVAAVNLAISEGKHNGINPFVSVVPDRDDEDERDAFTDADVKTIKENLHKLSANDQLLVRIVATTGMRRGEAFQIAGEQVEDGIRFAVVGTKTAQSLRRIPFPKDLLPYLPKKIGGPLLTGRQDTTSKRLTEFLTRIGVINEHDGRDLAAMHSFRHRAKNRLRDAVPDDELRDCIGGWKTKKNSGRKYGNKHGAGYSIKKLKAAIDKIGF